MPYHKLISGFQNFKRTYFQSDKSDEYQALVNFGQNPETLIIACSDSRIEPAILTNSNPGDFFAIRNVAALIPPYNNDGKLRGISAAIEYAVQALMVKHIVVLGHSGCGGVEALATGDLRNAAGENFEFLHHWLRIGQKAKQLIDEKCSGHEQGTKITLLEQASIIVSLQNLLTFPWIDEKCQTGTLQIHGWYFDMKAGDLREYDFENHLFNSIAPDSEHLPVKPPALNNFLESFIDNHAKL